MFLINLQLRNIVLQNISNDGNDDTQAEIEEACQEKHRLLLLLLVLSSLLCCAMCTCVTFLQCYVGNTEQLQLLLLLSSSSPFSAVSSRALEFPCHPPLVSPQIIIWTMMSWRKVMSHLMNILCIISFSDYPPAPSPPCAFPVKVALNVDFYTVFNFTQSVSFYYLCEILIWCCDLRCFVARQFLSRIYALLSVKFHIMYNFTDRV